MNEINFELKDIEAIDLSMGMGIKKVYPPIENLEVTPTKEQQVFAHENSYGYDEVIVKEIPDEYIIPDGTLNVDANGDVDVTMFKTARVGVYTPPTLQDKELTINENGTHNITYDEGYDGLNQVSVTVDAIENLDEELNTYNTKLTEQSTTIDDIIKTLQNKAIGGGTDEPVVEPDYITDGLIAWWEGCDDLDSSQHWNSRVGTDYISAINIKTGSISDNSFGFIKKENAYCNNMIYALATQDDYYVQGYTIEVVGVVYTTTSSNGSGSSSAGTLISFDKTASPRIAVVGTEQFFNSVNASASSGMEVKIINCINKRHKYALYLQQITDRTVQVGNLSALYAVNDSRWFQKEPSPAAGMTSRGNHMAVLCYYNNDYYAAGEISSIRIYNRQLTEEELKHNYEIDKARFKMDDYETA